tara:strand:+ start:115 stop:321 length:207 start_codon:yes stop_codon:yes gene_type:complete
MEARVIGGIISIILMYSEDPQVMVGVIKFGLFLRQGIMKYMQKALRGEAFLTCRTVATKKGEQGDIYN